MVTLVDGRSLESFEKIESRSSWWWKNFMVHWTTVIGHLNTFEGDPLWKVPSDNKDLFCLGFMVVQIYICVFGDSGFDWIIWQKSNLHTLTCFSETNTFSFPSYCWDYFVFVMLSDLTCPHVSSVLSRSWQICWPAEDRYPGQRSTLSLSFRRMASPRLQGVIYFYSWTLFSI